MDSSSSGEKRLEFVGFKQEFDPNDKLSIESWFVLAHAVEYVVANSGTELQAHGVCSDYIYFLSDGVAREYSIRPNQTEISRAFYQAKAVVGSLSSFKNSTPNKSSIQMLTNGQLYRVSCETLLSLMNQCDDLEYWYRLIMSRACLQSQNRLSSLLSKNHTQRLNDFVSESPELVRAVPAQHLSTYLNIPSVIINIVKKHVVRQLSRPADANSVMTA